MREWKDFARLLGSSLYLICLYIGLLSGSYIQTCVFRIRFWLLSCRSVELGLIFNITVKLITMRAKNLDPRYFKRGPVRPPAASALVVFQLIHVKVEVGFKLRDRLENSRTFVPMDDNVKVWRRGINQTDNIRQLTKSVTSYTMRYKPHSQRHSGDTPNEYWRALAMRFRGRIEKCR